MVQYQTIARPYAKAAFAFALERDEILAWQNMLTFSAGLIEHPQVAKLFDEQPYLKCVEVFHALSDGVLDEYGKNFIALLAENYRLQALPQILTAFEANYAQHCQQDKAFVSSACELSDAQKQSIQQALQKRYGKKITLVCQVDTSLIAGVCIQVGDQVIDSSVKTKLQRLAQQLQS